MGKKKISLADESEIVGVLRRWPPGRKLGWQALREYLAMEKNCDPGRIWSRQSLSANEGIHVAYAEAKRRVAESRRVRYVKTKTNEQYERQVQDLQSELAELRAKYDALLLRHTRLAYNVSQLERGNHLLTDPLPDNTRSQKG